MAARDEAGRARAEDPHVGDLCVVAAPDAFVSEPEEGAVPNGEVFHLGRENPAAQTRRAAVGTTILARSDREAVEIDRDVVGADQDRGPVPIGQLEVADEAVAPGLRERDGEAGQVAFAAAGIQRADLADLDHAVDRPRRVRREQRRQCEQDPR